MQLKKFFASLFAVLLVFSCSLLPSSSAWADDVLFQLYCYPNVSGYNLGSFRPPVLCGYTPTYEMPYSEFSYTTVVPALTFRTAPYDSNVLGGKTVYVGWYLAYTPNGSASVSIPSSYLTKEVLSSDSYVGADNSFTSISTTTLYNSTSNPYGTDPNSSWKTTRITALRFTLPQNSRAFRINIDGYNTNGVISLDRIYFPTLYVTGWGSDVADGLDDLLTELQTQTGTLNSILSVLNTIYTQCQAINTNTATTVSVLRSVLTELQTQTELLEDINTNIGNVQGELTWIESQLYDIYDLLDSALSDQAEELDEETQSAMQSVMMRTDAEQYWSDNNTANFDRLNLDDFSFSNAILGGLSAVGNIFTSLWSSLGDYTLVPLFALTLGISLVVIGRISRSGGKGGKDSKKGD